jgi:hypothetical protein
MHNTGSTISSLKIVDCSILRNEVGSAAAYAFDGRVAGTSIGDLIISGFSVTEQSGHTYTDIAKLVKLAGTSVSRLSFGGSVKGVGTVIDVTAASTVGNIEITDLSHTSNAGSPTSYALTVATSSGTVPVSVGRYKSSNVVGLASGSVLLSGPGLVATNFSFTNSKIANGNDFVSSDLGGRSFKDNTGTSYLLGVASAATQVIVTGPSNGLTNANSADFTVGFNGTITGTVVVTITPNDAESAIVKTFTTSTPQTFTIHPTSDGTVTLTVTNNGSLGDPDPLTYTTSAFIVSMEDQFTGTPGTALLNRVPDTTQHSTDVWGGPVFGGEGAMVIATGGGAVSSGAGPNWSVVYPHIGSGDKRLTYKFNSSTTSAVPTFYFNCDSGGHNFIAIDCNYGLQHITVSKMVADAFTGNIATYNVTLTTGVLYTLVLTVTGTSVTGTLDGVSLGSAATIPSEVGDAIVLKQQSGSAGDVISTLAKAEH